MQAAGVYWQKRLVRVLVAVLVLAGAIFLQYRLANIPLPVDVGKSTPSYTPVRVNLKQEELVVDHPSQQTFDGPPTNTPTKLFSDTGSDFVTTDIYFESARLREDTSKMLRSDPDETEFPTEGLTQIGYSTEGDEETPASKANSPQSKQNQNSDPCRTFISVELAKGARMPTELRFFQLEDPAPEYSRYFQMKAVGSDLVVRLSTSNRTGDDEAPGCSKTLLVGEWSRPLVGPVEINVVVPDGAQLKFSFASFGGETKWLGTNGLFEPFLVKASLSARAVRKITRQASPLGPPVFNANSLEGKQMLVLNHLMVGSDELQLDFAGEAMVQENGEDAVTFDLWEFAKKYPLAAGLLAMFDAGLLEGLRRVVFRPTRVEKQSKKPRRRSKKNRKASSGDGSS